MSKTVLIARPHIFIVSVMKPFLEKNGYGTRKLELIYNLRSLSAGIAGAVISLALSSSIAESAEEVFLQFKQSSPRTPVLFAARLTLDQARPALERIAHQAGIEATILGISANPAAAALLGRQDAFLYLNKDDLTLPERHVMAMRLVQRHFQ